ncbi:MAG: TerD family protein, partial [Myxococcota bacterium]
EGLCAGELARRLDHLLRTSVPGEEHLVLSAFAEQIHRVDTRVLIQALGHFTHRVGLQQRVVFTKSSPARPFLMSTPPPDLSRETVERVVKTIREALLVRFGKLAPLGSVWIDPRLEECPVPLQMRAASEGLEVLQRGTRVPLGTQRTLRFFVHWIGVDIDLSAAFLTEDLQYHSELAYYALKAEGGTYKAAHSGDVTSAPAPDGACEFIDIDLDSVDPSQVRYIAMDVRVYAGAPFPFQSANAGWMMRDDLGQANEVFDARTVKQRIAIGAHARSCLVALFDVVAREVIWLDLVGSSHSVHGGNNVASNRRNIRDVAAGILNSRLLSMNDLLELHRHARGSAAVSREDAQTRFDHAMVYDYVRVLRDFMS